MTPTIRAMCQTEPFCSTGTVECITLRSESLRGLCKHISCSAPVLMTIFYYNETDGQSKTEYELRVRNTTK